MRNRKLENSELRKEQSLSKHNDSAENTFEFEEKTEETYNSKQKYLNFIKTKMKSGEAI